MLFWNLVFFIIACLVLVKSSNWLLKSLIKISGFFHVSEFSVGFIVLAISTSLPEMFVGIMSAIRKTPLLSLGNVIGSNILDLTIVIGITALLAKTIKIEAKTIKKDIIYMLVIMSLPIVLAIDHHFWFLFNLFPNMIQGLSRIDGAILLSIFVYYIWSLLRQQKSFHKEIEKTTKKELLHFLILYVISTALLLISSEFVVEYANNLALDLNISNILIGLFIVSLGTSLPELMMETNSVLNHHNNLAIGDLIGSVIANSTLVLGVTAIVYPITGDFFTSAIFMILIGFIFMTFSESNSELTWREGLSLIFLYIFFIIVETYMRTNI